MNAGYRMTDWRQTDAGENAVIHSPVARRPARTMRRDTYTGSAHRAWRATLLAQLHGSAAVRGVSFEQIARHTRLARLIG